MESKADVVIVGAGPGGLTAARFLSALDIDFILLSKEEIPCENKTCGGFVPNRALQEFSIDPIKESHPIKSVRMKFPGMDMVKVDFDEVIGVNVKRGNLGTTMKDMVVKSSETIRMNSKVTGIKRERDSIRIHYDVDGEDNSVRSRILIDASGANSVTSRMGLVRPRISNEGMGYGLQYHLRKKNTNVEFDHAIDFYYGSDYSPGGYAWVFPRAKEVVIGTGGIVSRVQTTERKLNQYLEYIIDEVEPTCSELSGSVIYKKDAAVMPLAGIITPSYDDGILLIGDAAGHCSPITGEGIYYSMIGGRIAAYVSKEALQESDVSSSFLSRYERAWKREIGSDLKWGMWLQKRLISEGSSGMGARFLRSAKSQRIIAEMLVGIRSVKSAIFTVAPSYMKSKLGF